MVPAERSGDLERAFDSLAGDMADEVDTRSQRLLAMLEPLLIVFLAVIVGTIVIALFLPLISIIGNLSNG